MKINLKKLLESYVLIVLISVILFMYFSNIKIYFGIRIDAIITFAIIAGIILVNVVKDKRKYSLNKVFWYFSFFFLFLAPLFQYVSNYNMWGYKINDDSYFKTNIVLIVWLIVYMLSYKFINIKAKYKTIDEINLKKSNLYYMLILSIIAILLLGKLIGFSNLLKRSTNSLDVGAENISLVLSNFMRTVPVYGLAYSIYYYKKNKKGLLAIGILLLITVVLNYPVSVTRYWIGAVYIGIMLILLENVIGDKMFDLGMIFIFAIAFPIFQIFKWYNLSDIFQGKVVLSNLINVYNNADFDAYSMLARSFDYVSKFNITYGKQLISSILFFIPRAVWPNKAVPTGQLIAESQNQNFTNLSCPLVAEGFVNFGYIGVIVYAFGIAIILKYLDNLYWKRNNEKITFICFIYPFCMGLLVFLLRGAFHPVVVYTFTFFLYLIIWKAIKIVKNIVKGGQ